MSNAAEKIPVFEEDSVLPPPLKWAGGKRWLIPKLTQLYAPFKKNRLVEPFAGGLAVALGLQPERAILNDVNPHLINFYQQIKNGLEISSEQKNEREYFFSERARFNQLVKEGKGNSKEAAEIFYYLNRTGFNGLCRFNGSGEFNVPFGKYSTIPYRRDFSQYTALFAAWDFSCEDFEKIEVQDSDFLYVDPPYDVEFTTYSKGGFTWEDQKRLVSWLSSKKCPIVASNQATDRIIQLYADAGFTIEKVLAPRRISSSGDRSPALEMIATKNL